MRYFCIAALCFFTAFNAFGSAFPSSSRSQSKGQIDTKELTVLPVLIADGIIFPDQFASFTISYNDSRLSYMQSIAAQKHQLVFLLAPREEEGMNYAHAFDSRAFYSVGTIAVIKNVTSSAYGDVKIFLQGISRAKLKSFSIKNNDLYANIEHVHYRQEAASEEIKRLFTLVGDNVLEMLGLSKDERQHKPEKIIELVMLGAGKMVGEEDKLSFQQQLLECTSSTELVQTFNSAMEKFLFKKGLKREMEDKTQDAIQKANKKFFLKQQLKAIKDELGEGKPHTLAEKLEKLPLPEEVRVEVDRRLDRLEHLLPESPESEFIQSYLDWIIKLPWGKVTTDNLDVAHAKAILDEDHYGLKDIKERLLDYIAVRNLSPDGKAPILCLVGPPGVGKTSLAKSIARSLGRSYTRISLGGMHDESEIRGHRSSYVGALPGRFIQALQRAGSMNPVMLLDEIDKISNANFKGDPSAALLEVLDPEQNSSFHDNYLGVPFDLSQVLFITTANTLDTIPLPLRDRMEIIHLSGYSSDEKIHIAEQYLVKKSCKDAGLEQMPLHISQELIADIIEHYTHEAGVRSLERQIKKLCAKAARSWVESKERITVTSENLEQHLGPRKFLKDTVEQMTRPTVGVANGLGTTTMGGEVLKVESIIMPGKGRLILTGSLGSVMKESANAALSYVRSHASEFDIKENVFRDYDLHIHFPEGAAPKDGPSAGIAILSSILSAITGRKLDGGYAMTGELTLQGRVMPIGGVKAKILAAKRSGIPHVILPEKNKRDLILMPELAEGVDIIWVSHASEVLSRVLMAPDVAVA